MADLFYFMRKNPVDLLKYLPKFLPKDETFKDAQVVLGWEHEQFRLKLIDVAKQFFLETSTWGLSDWERFLGIKPDANQNFDLRKAVARVKLRGADTMTVSNTLRMMREFMTSGEPALEELGDCEIRLILDNAVYSWQELFQALLTYLPAHLDFSLKFYNHYRHDLYIGTPEIYADVEKIPYAMLTDENLNLKIIPAQVDTSFEKFSVDFASINENQLGIFLILGESDCEVIRAEIVEEEFDGKLYELLRKLWYKWSHNPLVKQYKHHFDIEVLPPEEEDDDEVTGDYLSLYFHFPTRDKIVKVGNPTEPVDRQKIKLLSRYAAANKFLTNKYGEYTSGISKAIVYKIKNYELRINS